MAGLTELTILVPYAALQYTVCCHGCGIQFWEHLLFMLCCICGSAVIIVLLILCARGLLMLMGSKF